MVFFSFNHTSYSQWTPVYFNDCLKLPGRIPYINDKFIKGRFIVKHTERKSSGLPMDQDLEKEYDKV